MTVLVTGGAGYIGSHMVLQLLDEGEKVVVLDDLSTGFRWAVPQGVPLIVGDIGDEQLVAEIIQQHGVTEIAHFAAKIIVPDSVADPLRYYENNTAKARSLLAAAVRGGVKHFIFSSTAAVYGEPTVSPIAETVTPAPINPYGRSKLMVEWMLEDTAHAHDLTYVALRYFNVAGADPQGRTGQSTPDTTHLIKVATQCALGMRPGMDVYGTDYPTQDGSCVRDFIHVTDLIRAHMYALRHLRDGGKSLTCNVGYARGYSVLDVIETVKRLSGVDFPVRYVDRRPGDPAQVIASNELIRSLGWRPEHDNLDEIVRQALDWERGLAKKMAA